MLGGRKSMLMGSPLEKSLNTTEVRFMTFRILVRPAVHVASTFMSSKDSLLLTSASACSCVILPMVTSCMARRWRAPSLTRKCRISSPKMSRSSLLEKSRPEGTVVVRRIWTPFA